MHDRNATRAVRWFDVPNHELHAQLLQEKFGIDPGKLVAEAAQKGLGSL